MLFRSLTHGTKVSFSGKWFDAVHYGVDKETENIDYDETRAYVQLVMENYAYYRSLYG